MEKFREMIRGWLGYTLLALLMVPFMFFGIESYFTSAGHDNTIATVNGEKIDRHEFEQIFQQQRQAMLEKMGPDADPSQLDSKKLRQQVMDALTHRQFEVQGARAMGLDFPQSLAWQMLGSQPVFQKDGHFDAAIFKQFLQQRGYTEQGLLHDIQIGGTLSQLESGMAAGFVTPEEVNRLLALDGQSRDADYLILPNQALATRVTISAAQIQDYYQQHLKDFIAPEQVSLSYVELRKSDFLAQVQVSDDDLQKAYADFTKAQSGKEMRHAEHILIKVDDKTTPAQALAKIQAIAAQLAAGANFEKLAREYSQDEGSVASGGDLGTVPRGEFVPEFDQVLFSLKPGQVSAPVKTRFGYHLIKLIAIEEPKVPPLASIADQLRQQVREQKAAQKFAEQVNTINDDMYEAADLKDPAAKYHLPVQATALFSSGQGMGIASDAKVRATAFSDDILKDGKNSAAVELNKDDVVWVHLAQHQPAYQRTLAQVTDAIHATLLAQAEAASAKTQVAAWAKEVQAGQDITAQIQALGAHWVHQDAITRTTALPDPELLRAIFWTPRPAAKPSVQAVPLAAASALVVLRAVHDHPASASHLDPVQVTSMMDKAMSAQNEADLVNALQARAKIVITANGQQLLQQGAGE